MEKRKNQGSKPLKVTGNKKPVIRNIPKPIINNTKKELTKEPVEDKPVLPPEEARKLANTYYLEAMMVRGKDKKKAILLLLQAVKINPEFIEAYYNLAVFLFETGQYDKALEIYLKLLELNPDHEDALYNLGNLHYTKYRFEKAVECFKKVEELNSGAVDAIYNAGFISFNHLKDYFFAIGQFKKVLKLQPSHVEARYNLGFCEYMTGNKEGSLKIFEELTRRAPAFSPSYYNVALIYKELGANDRAMVMLQKYLDFPEKSHREVDYVRYAARRLKEFHKE